MDKKSLGIYIHIPFCKSRCIYCDFVSSIVNKSNMQKYCDYLVRQIDMASKEYSKYYQVDTIYFGGGTPSLLASEDLKRITDCLKDKFELNTREVSIEANPCTIDERVLQGFKDAGITRVSIGVQSFDDNLLKMLGRAHDRKTALDAIRLTKKYGFDVSIDCMCGLPEQTIEDVEEFIDIADKEGVEHISVYMLSVEDGTKLQEKIQKGELKAKTDDEIANIYDTACLKLKEKGYSRYEISNFCKNNKASIHNLRYWQRKDYLGLGLSSHSLTMDNRWNNPYTFEEYYELIDKGIMPRLNIENLTTDDIKEEMIMLSLRLKEGIDLKEYNKLFGDFKKEFALELAKNKKYLDISDDHIAIKDEYLEVMNSIIVDFLK